MKIWSIILMLIFSVFIASCATAPPVPTTKTIQGPPVGSPVAEQPMYRVGDSWTYKSRSGNVTTRVADVDLKNGNGNIITVNSNSPQCRQLRDKNFTLINLEGICNNPKTGVKFLDFPFSKDKSWGSGARSRKSSDLGIIKYLEVIKVMGYEKVKVAAGEFEAFRLERKSSAITGQVTLVYYWYAPKVKNIIKWKNIYAPSTSLLPEEFELVDYKVS